jgi:chemotaxis response regulator CheB
MTPRSLWIARRTAARCRRRGGGGTITGADEHPGHGAPPVGARAGRHLLLPGGRRYQQPWSASVTFHATPGEAVTIAASTGGPVAVERFAVTGERAG